MLRKTVLRNTSLPIHDQVNQHHTRSIVLHNTQCCATWLIVYRPLYKYSEDERLQCTLEVTLATNDHSMMELICDVKERQKKKKKKQEVLGRTNRLLSLIRHGPHWKRRVQQLEIFTVVVMKSIIRVSSQMILFSSSIVACVFVTAVTFLPSRCLAKIGGFSPSRCHLKYNQWRRRDIKMEAVHFPPKCWYSPTWLHDLITHKTTIYDSKLLYMM
jgi:hypothetical protein